MRFWWGREGPRDQQHILGWGMPKWARALAGSPRRAIITLSDVESSTPALLRVVRFGQRQESDLRQSGHGPGFHPSAGGSPRCYGVCAARCGVAMPSCDYPGPLMVTLAGVVG